MVDCLEKDSEKFWIPPSLKFARQLSIGSVCFKSGNVAEKLSPEI